MPRTKLKNGRHDLAEPGKDALRTQPGCAGEMVCGLMGRLTSRGQFKGAFDTADMFEHTLLPDGIQIATHARQGAGAVLADMAAGLSFAGLEASHVAFVSVDGALRDRFDATPDWNMCNIGGMTASMTLPGMTLTLECKDAFVDPLFTGQALRGAVLILQAEATGASLH